MANITEPLEDTTFDLGVPTELESYHHQCLMLVDELHEASADIRRLKGGARTLVAMNDALTAELNALKAVQLIQATAFPLLRDKNGRLGYKYIDILYSNEGPGMVISFVPARRDGDDFTFLNDHRPPPAPFGEINVDTNQ